jgi:hypothetical protein
MDMKFGGTDISLLEAPPAVVAVQRIADGFKAFQVMRAGFASGLFDWLAQNGPADKSAIAAALKLRGAHLGGFLQALEDLGLLVRQNTGYALAPDASEALTAASPWCQAAMIDSLLATTSGWSDLTNFLTEGWVQDTQQQSLPLELYPYFGEARRLVAHLAARLAGRPDSRSVHTLLCFDGSDGLFAAVFCRHFPEARATVVVMPDALPRAEEIIAAFGLSERCRLLPGTPLDPVPREECSGFDYAVLFHSIYPVRKSTADALAAVAASLASGGELCCAHWFCLEACETAPGGLRDLDKAVLTDSHPLCHVEHFCQRLEEAGLVDVERVDLAGEYGNAKLHFARRPVSA